MTEGSQLTVTVISGQSQWAVPSRAVAVGNLNKQWSGFSRSVQFWFRHPEGGMTEGFQLTVTVISGQSQWAVPSRAVAVSNLNKQW